MISHFGQYLVVVRRKSNTLKEIEIFAHVAIEIEDSFRARCCELSRATLVRFSSDNQATISEYSCKDRCYVSVPWYEEKYICNDSLDLYDQVSKITESREVRAWLGARI